MNIIKFIPSSYFGANTYLLCRDNEGILIDCSIGIQEILNYNKNVNIKAILLTHTHFDHILKVNEICEHFNCPVYVLQGYQNRLKNSKLNLSEEYNSKLLLNDNINIITFKNNEILKFFNEKIKVICTNGHSECSVCFLIGENLFSGDTLFNRAIGRYDFFDSNKNELLNSLKIIKTIKFKNGYAGHEENYDYISAMQTIETYIKFLEKR